MYFFSVIGEIQVEEENDLHLIKNHPGRCYHSHGSSGGREETQK